MEGRVRKQLTRRQRQVYDWIAAFIASRGYPPSYSDICIGLGMKSRHGSKVNVDALERKGWLTKRPFTARSIVLLPQGEPA